MKEGTMKEELRPLSPVPGNAFDRSPLVANLPNIFSICALGGVGVVPKAVTDSKVALEPFLSAPKNRGVTISLHHALCAP